MTTKTELSEMRFDWMAAIAEADGYMSMATHVDNYVVYADMIYMNVFMDKAWEKLREALEKARNDIFARAIVVSKIVEFGADEAFEDDMIEDSTLLTLFWQEGSEFAADLVAERGYMKIN